MSEPRPLWRRWLAPAVLALLAVNLIVFAVWTLPRERRQRSAVARAEAARAQVRRERARTLALRERAAAIRANASDLDRFYSRHTGTERTDLIPTLEAIEALARLPGLRPGAQSYTREPVQGLPLERVAISLPVEGSYDQLVAFLREIERSPRFLTVDGVSMTGRPGSAAQLRVELSTYLKVQPGELRSRSGRGR